MLNRRHGRALLAATPFAAACPALAQGRSPASR